MSVRPLTACTVGSNLFIVTTLWFAVVFLIGDEHMLWTHNGAMWKLTLIWFVSSCGGRLFAKYKLPPLPRAPG